MVVLRPTNLHCIKGSVDDPWDLCAHSGVEFRTADDLLVQPSDGDWTVSAAALYLLRTLSQPRTKRLPVAEHLFPHCGHGMFEEEGQDDVVIFGCNIGIDFEVVHFGASVVLTGMDGRAFEVAAEEWRRAVYEFSDAVQAFYDVSSPKVFERSGCDERGFRKFRAEWSRRRSVDF